MKFSECCSIIFVIATTTSATPLIRSTKTTISWSNCTAGQFSILAGLLPANETLPGIECGKIHVPLDYAGKDKGTIDLGFTRIKTNSTKRLGTLIYNPGGPGGSGALQIAAQGLGLFTAVSDVALANYDIIGYDPRGVGLSTPVKCDPKILNQHVSQIATEQTTFDALVAKNKALGASCAKLTGPLINHLDTTNVAKDLELIRAALDDGKLNFVGVSYGTQIGSQYAELYPEKIGRFVLDSNVDHSQSASSSVFAEATTFEATLNQWFQWCNTTDDCVLRGKDAVGILKNITAATSNNPIPAPGCKETGACQPEVWGEDIISNVQGWLAVKGNVLGVSTNWAGLSQALFEASQGNATILSNPLAQSESDGLFAGLAILCQDWIHNSKGPQDFSLRQSIAKSFTPLTKGISQSSFIQSSCIGWPAPVSNPQHYLDQKKTSKAPPILLINSVFDSETSLLWAEGLKAQLSGSKLVIRDGAGHGSYYLNGETTKVIDAFLVNGTLPMDGTVTST